MSTFGWIALIVLFLIIVSAAVIMFVKTPKSKSVLRIIALLPLVAGVVYAGLIPADLIFTDESISTFLRTIIPFMCVAGSLPLIIKGNRETKNVK